MADFFRCFKYAFSGIVYAVVHERNMRVHLCFLGYMVFFLKRYDFFKVSKAEFALLTVTAALVIALEYVNTAIERAVDLAGKGEISQKAKIAKDTAAGAVLIAAAGAVVCGIEILWQPEAFRMMAGYFAGHPARCVAMIASIVCAVLLIFLLPTNKGGEKVG